MTMTKKELIEERFCELKLKKTKFSLRMNQWQKVILAAALKHILETEEITKKDNEDLKFLLKKCVKC